MSAAPPFSVILVCRNPGPGLPRAVDSVRNQTGAEAELIVIDGASTDGSREWLEARRDQLGALVSEPDGGIYEAMNKGVALARGEWILFLGADDCLATAKVLHEVLPWLQPAGAAVVAGEARYGDGRIYRLAQHPNPIARNFLHHQAAFYRRSLFSDHGGFDPALAVMGDYDFNLRLWQNQVRFQPMPVRVAECGARGLSDRGGWRGYREEITVRHRFFPAGRCGLWDFFSVLRCLRKKIVLLLTPHHG